MDDLVPTSGRDVADVVFKGCVNRTEVAAYLAAQAMEQRIKGAAIGLLAGIIGTCVTGLYLRHRAGG